MIHSVGGKVDDMNRLVCHADSWCLGYRNQPLAALSHDAPLRVKH